MKHRCYFDTICQSEHSKLYFKEDVTHDADLAEYYMIEPLIVPNRSEAPENDTMECSNAAKHLHHWDRLQNARVRALLRPLRLLYARLRCTPPTCKITPSFREHVRR